MFATIGMEAFAERARRELLATGDKVRKRSDETRGQLTPQEEQIARLAREASRIRRSARSSSSVRARSSGTCARCSRSSGSTPVGSSRRTAKLRLPNRLRLSSDVGKRLDDTLSETRGSSWFTRAHEYQSMNAPCVGRAIGRRHADRLMLVICRLVAQRVKRGAASWLRLVQAIFAEFSSLKFAQFGSTVGSTHWDPATRRAVRGNDHTRLGLRSSRRRSHRGLALLKQT
jgi:hypothetical protein